MLLTFSADKSKIKYICHVIALLQAELHIPRPFCACAKAEAKPALHLVGGPGSGLKVTQIQVVHRDLSESMHN